MNSICIMYLLGKVSKHFNDILYNLEFATNMYTVMVRRRGLCSTDSLTEAMSSEVAKPSSSEDCFSPPSLHTIFRPPQFKGAKIGKEMVFALYITEWHTAYTSHFSGLFLHCHFLKHRQDASPFFENKRKGKKWD